MSLSPQGRMGLSFVRTTGFTSQCGKGRFRYWSSPFPVEGNSSLARTWAPREGIGKKDAGK